MLDRFVTSIAYGTLVGLSLGACSGSDGSPGGSGGTGAGAPAAGTGTAGAVAGVGAGGTNSAGTPASAGALVTAGGGSPSVSGSTSAAGMSAGSSGSPSSAGALASAGTGGGGGSPGSSGMGGTTGPGGAGKAGTVGVAGASGSGGGPATTPFSFFVTSMEAMKRLSKSDKGFGGDLRYTEADGLSGADKICTEIAEHSLPGSGQKQWRAFLSAAMGPGGGPVHAIDRIGSGPWFDRLGRRVATSKADLLNPRPRNADPAIANDLPNEYGVPNHRPDPAQPAVDNHHVLTGSNDMGQLYGPNSTCSSWTSLAQSAGRPRIGFSWPVSTRQHWISGQDEGGCGAGIVITDGGGSDPSNPVVGSGGGYGGIYCFALTP